MERTYALPVIKKRLGNFLRKKTEVRLFKILDQRDLIEANDWSDIIIFDACRHDFFKKYYGEYFTGKLLEVWNGGVGWTFEWFKRTFRIKYDAVLFTPLAVTRTGGVVNNEIIRFLLDSSPFLNVVSNREIGSKPLDFAPQFVNEAVKTSDWKCRKIIHYFAPHPPFFDIPCLNGKIGGAKLKRLFETGEITIQDIRRGYTSNLKMAFEAAIEIMPYLGKKVIITADHGECLGDCGRLLHGAGYNHEHIVNVPWFEVESVVNTGRMDV